MIPLTIASKIILKIKLTKVMYVLHTESYKKSFETKMSLVDESEDAGLLRQQYSPNGSTDSLQSLSNSNWFLPQKWTH